MDGVGIDLARHEKAHSIIEATNELHSSLSSAFVILTVRIRIFFNNK